MNSHEDQLKRKIAELQQIYLELLKDWEITVTNIRVLNEERKFFKRKLDDYFNGVTEPANNTNRDDSKLRVVQCRM